VTFAAFPRAYAVMFSSLYTPLMLLLFALILRGISFEFRGKEDSRAWKATWDGCLLPRQLPSGLLSGASPSPTIFKGLPLDAEGLLQWQPPDPPQLVRPARRCALFRDALFLVHGAVWALVIKSDRDLRARAIRVGDRTVARSCWVVAVVFPRSPSWFATPALRQLPSPMPASLGCSRCRA